MNKILVTGGAGFIGSNLCRELIKNKENKVICLDNYSTGSKNNIENLLQYENFEAIKADIRNPINVKVDKIFNLACPASPIHYQKDPIFTMTTCVNGTLNLLNLAKENDAIFFHASTSEIYGDPNEHPQKESYFGNVNSVGIRSCYDEGKRAAETLIYDFRRLHKLNIKVARIFNTFGPYMAVNDGRVVSNFILNALKNHDLIIYGDGSKTRSFCYIDDLISGILILTSNKQDFDRPHNIGNDKEIKIIELAQTIIKLTGSSSKVVFKDPLSDDPYRRKPDLAKIKKIYWEPIIELEVGIKKTIDYFKN